MNSFDKYTEYVDFPCHYARLEWLFNTIKNNRKSDSTVKILDVGCGTGNITIPLGLIDNSEVLGIDIHQGNVDISESRNTLPNVKVKFESLFDCNLAPHDYIILTEVLEHISFYKDILDYIGKNGKQTMELQITVPNGFGPFEIGMQPLYFMRKIGLNGFIWKVKKILGKKEPYSQNYETPHVNFFTVSRMKREVQNYGMEVFEVKNAYFIAPIIETYLPFIPLKTISKIDNAIAQVLPHFLASGHYYRIRKKNK